MGTSVTRGLGRVARLVFSPVYRLLLSVALVLGRVNTFLLLGVSFFGMVLPIGLVRRRTRAKELSGWIKREPREPDHYRRQF
jgi:hypothetical protein